MHPSQFQQLKDASQMDSLAPPNSHSTKSSRFYYSKIVTHNSDDVEILKTINIDPYSVFVDKLVSSKFKYLFPLLVYLWCSEDFPWSSWALYYNTNAELKLTAIPNFLTDLKLGEDLGSIIPPSLSTIVLRSFKKISHYQPLKHSSNPHLNMHLPGLHTIIGSVFSSSLLCSPSVRKLSKLLFIPLSIKLNLFTILKWGVMLDCTMMMKYLT